MSYYPVVLAKGRSLRLCSSLALILMAKSKQKKKNTKQTKKKRVSKKTVSKSGNEFGKESFAVLLGFFGVFLLLSLGSYISNGAPDSPRASNMLGLVGSFSSYYLFLALGWCSFVSVLWAFLLAYSVLRGEEESERPFGISFLASLVMAISLAVIASSSTSFAFNGRLGGGVLGKIVSASLSSYVNSAGAVLISLFVFMVSFGVATGCRLSDFFAVIGRGLTWMGGVCSDIWFSIREAVGALFYISLAVLSGVGKLLSLSREASSNIPRPNLNISRTRKAPIVTKDMSDEEIVSKIYTIGEDLDSEDEEPAILSSKKVANSGIEPEVQADEIKISRYENEKNLCSYCVW